MPRQLSDPPLAPKPRPSEVDEPPFLKSWPRVYAAVILYLAGLLLLLTAISRSFYYN